MSIEARQALVSHPHTIFQRQSQRDDLLSPETTQTGLIAFLTELIDKGHIILFTAVKTDHHDDRDLGGVHCHYNGYCADVWLLNSTNPTDYIDAQDPRFQRFLEDAAGSQWLHQIGLAGSADCSCDIRAAGPTEFDDGGADHIHLGSHN